MIQKLLRLSKIKVFRGPVKITANANTILHCGDKLTIDTLPMDDDKNQNKENDDDLFEKISYIDDNIMVLNKPANLSMHSGSKTTRHLSQYLSSLRFDAKENPRIVHRLDKETSGLLILARNLSFAQKLSALFQNSLDHHSLQLAGTPSIDAFGRQIFPSTSATHDTTDATDINNNGQESLLCDSSIEKIYWAVVIGAPRSTSGSIDRFIAIPSELNDDTAPRNLHVKVAHPSKTTPYSHHLLKRSITDYETIPQDSNASTHFTWLRLSPKTGRKHQLRVHCATVLGCPIVGDRRYGAVGPHIREQVGNVNFQALDSRGERRLFLHCRQITIKNYFSAGKDLVVRAGVSSHWKELAKECGIDLSRLNA